MSLNDESFEYIVWFVISIDSLFVSSNIISDFIKTIQKQQIYSYIKGTKRYNLIFTSLSYFVDFYLSYHILFTAY